MLPGSSAVRKVLANYASLPARVPPPRGYPLFSRTFVPTAHDLGHLMRAVGEYRALFGPPGNSESTFDVNFLVVTSPSDSDTRRSLVIGEQVFYCDAQGTNRIGRWRAWR